MKNKKKYFKNCMLKKKRVDIFYNFDNYSLSKPSIMCDNYCIRFLNFQY